jgi:hypothetical protein
MPRPQDEGAVSLARAELVTGEEARTNPQKPHDRTFGLCALDIAEVREMTGGVISFWGISGQKHVQMFGCDNLGAAAFVASLAKVFRPPGP